MNDEQVACVTPWVSVASGGRALDAFCTVLGSRPRSGT